MQRTENEKRMLKVKLGGLGAILVGIGVPFATGMIEAHNDYNGIPPEMASHMLHYGAMYLDGAIGAATGAILSGMPLGPEADHKFNPKWFAAATLGLGGVGVGLAYASRAAGKAVGYAVFTQNVHWR
jgi:hypothetical protein